MKSTDTYTSMLAPPISYEIDGVQYVSILTGSGGGDLFSGEPMDPVAMTASLNYGNYGRMLVFSLEGTKPTAPSATVWWLDPAARFRICGA
jgi:quinohemoprotein ethanol dehydrogenase